MIVQQIASSNELYHVGCVWQTKSFCIPRITNNHPDTVYARTSASVRVCVVSTDSVYMLACVVVALGLQTLGSGKTGDRFDEKLLSCGNTANSDDISHLQFLEDFALIAVDKSVRLFALLVLGFV